MKAYPVAAVFAQIIQRSAKFFEEDKLYDFDIGACLLVRIKMVTYVAPAVP